MKRSKWKRWIAVLLALTLLYGLCVMSTLADYDTAGATVFVFSDDGIAVTEGNSNAYKIEGTALTISGAGTYVVSGSCADGSIKIKKGSTGVTLVLDGLTLSSSTTAPISCNKSTEVTIVAAAGSVNDLRDSAYNNDESYPDNADAENAVIKTKDGSRVTICGTGTINVWAYGKNGVKGGATTEAEGEAWLSIQDVTLNIRCYVNDGLKSDQTLNILSGTVTVSTVDDGIKSDYSLNIGAAGTAGPTVTVAESEEGIEATTLNIYSGTVTVHASDDGLNAANSDLTGYAFSCNISGGSVYVDAQSGDGIDSNGSLNISGGTVQVYSASSGDNSPLDAETDVLVTGGTVLAVGAPGMGVRFSQGSQNYAIFGGSAMGGPGMGGGMPGGQGGVSVNAGSTITVLDSSGSTLYSGTAVRAASCVIFSSPALTNGETYTLSVNGSAAATATAGSGTGSGFQPTPPGDGTQPTPPGDGTQPTPPGDGTQPTPPGDGTQPTPPGDGTQPTPPGDGTQPTPPGDGTQPTPPGDGTQPTPPEQGGPGAGFYSDLNPGAWYFEAARWAEQTDVMQPESDTVFGVNSACTRAETVLALWKAAGSPAPSGAESPFVDVSESDAWYQAVLWAVESGVTYGMDATHFGPDRTVTRAQAVAFLYRAWKGGTPSETNPFADVPSGAWYADAVLWAVAEGITKGVSATAFDPNGTLTRGHIVTFLYRAYAA